LEIQYHPGKANVVAHALSRKGQVNNITAYLMSQELCWEMEHLNLGMVNNIEATKWNLHWNKEFIKEKNQMRRLKILKTQIGLGKAPDFTEDEQDTNWFKKRICVLEIERLHQLILREAHDSAYSIHPGSIKKYQDLKEMYFSYLDVMANLSVSQMCARIKSHTYDDSWYIN
jgi:hypothetical protein